MVMSHNVFEPTLGVVGNDAWSTEAYEWEVCCSVPYPTVSTELCVPKHFHLLHCIRLSAKPLSGPDFALPSGTVFDLHTL
ncbi:uncharacterized protein TNCV_1456301 [Trichonephila clavipes]|nr:uncharacterized protein TNCV_1456301 [Trichonephila clavipes]